MPNDKRTVFCVPITKSGDHYVIQPQPAAPVFEINRADVIRVEGTLVQGNGVTVYVAEVVQVEGLIPYLKQWGIVEYTPTPTGFESGNIREKFLHLLQD